MTDGQRILIMFIVSQEFLCFVFRYLLSLLKNVMPFSAECCYILSTCHQCSNNLSCACLSHLICAYVCIQHVSVWSHQALTWQKTEITPYSASAVLSNWALSPKWLRHRHKMKAHIERDAHTHAHTQTGLTQQGSLNSRHGDNTHSSALMQCRWIKYPTESLLSIILHSKMGWHSFLLKN